MTAQTDQGSANDGPWTCAPNPAGHLFLHGLQAKNGFCIFRVEKHFAKYFTTCKNPMMSASIAKTVSHSTAVLAGDVVRVHLWAARRLWPSQRRPRGVFPPLPGCLEHCSHRDTRSHGDLTGYECHMHLGTVLVYYLFTTSAHSSCQNKKKDNSEL